MPDNDHLFFGRDREERRPLPRYPDGTRVTVTAPGAHRGLHGVVVEYETDPILVWRPYRVRLDVEFRDMSFGEGELCPQVPDAATEPASPSGGPLSVWDLLMADE